MRLVFDKLLARHPHYRVFYQQATTSSYGVSGRFAEPLRIAAFTLVVQLADSGIGASADIGVPVATFSGTGGFGLALPLFGNPPGTAGPAPAATTGVDV